jgi:hypothetical protein
LHYKSLFRTYISEINAFAFFSSPAVKNKVLGDKEKEKEK